MSDCVEHGMELLREHEYMTGGDGRGSAAPLVCSCGHREKSSSAGEPLQSVHLRHLLFVLDDAGMLTAPRPQASTPKNTVKEYLHDEYDGITLDEAMRFGWTV